MSFGERQVEEAIAKIVAAAKHHNKYLGRPGGTPEQIERYMKQGFVFFQGPSDLALMRGGARALLDPFGKRGIDPKTRSLY